MKGLLVFVFFIPVILFSQNRYIDYLNKSNEAEYFFYTNNLNEALKLYSEIELSEDSLRFKDFFYLGAVSFLNSDSIKGMKYFRQFANLHGNATQFLAKSKNKYPKLVLSNYQIEELLAIQKTKLSEVKIGTTIVDKYRLIHDSIEFYLNLDAENRKESEQIDTLRDFIIQTAYLNYLKKYGLPYVAINGDRYLHILFHVYNKKLLILYKEFFYSEILKGNSSPYAYAILVDRTMNKSTVYGSHAIKPETKEEKNKVEENRKKIGMSTHFNLACFFPIVND